MKKNFIAITVILVLGSARYISPILATPEKVDGISIFTDSRPAGNYESLGTLKTKTVQVGDNIQGQDGLSVCGLTYGQMKADFLKQIKKKYSTANGLIIRPESETAEAIILK